MNLILAFAFGPVLYFVTFVNAQSPCLECFRAAQEELVRCLNNAISQEDKNSCEDKQRDQSKVCENGECKLEREGGDQSNEALPEKQ